MDFLESATAIIGQRSSGKTGLLKVTMEELVRCQLPFVAFDSVGILWGIRSSFDGTGPGLPVLVIGGERGDIEFDRKAGSTVADAIVKANTSVIIDVSMEPKSAYREFVTDFCNELFRVNDSSRLVVIDEAPDFVPQKPRPEMGRVYDAVERLVAKGRNKGIGVILISQRVATINKDVLSQIQSLFVFNQVDPRDVKAIKDWFQSFGQTKEEKQFLQDMLSSLPSLETRNAYFWSPKHFGEELFEKMYVNSFKTFHPDRTHLRRMGYEELKPVTTDVEGMVNILKSVMSPKVEIVEEVPKKTVKKASNGEDDDMSEEERRELRELRERIAELERKPPEQTAPRESDKEVTAIKHNFEVLLKESGEAVRTFTTGTYQGKVLFLLANDFHLEATGTQIIEAAKEYGWPMDKRNTYAQMGKLVKEGFLIKEDVGFRIPGKVSVKVNE